MRYHFIATEYLKGKKIVTKESVNAGSFFYFFMRIAQIIL